MHRNVQLELFSHLFAMIVGMMIIFLPQNVINAQVNFVLCFVLISLYAFLAVTNEDRSELRKNLIVCVVWSITAFLQAISLIWLLKS